MGLWQMIKEAIHPTPPSEPSQDPVLLREKNEAQQAKEKAERDLRTAKKRSGEVALLAQSLAESRQRNHFGEAIEIAFQRKS